VTGADPGLDRGTVLVRNTRPEDFDQVIELCREVYPGAAPWARAQLASHLEVFPEGQFVAVAGESGGILGMAASLIIPWDDYDITKGWRDFTAGGHFVNHDPARGRTLYGAEVMVRPGVQRRGVGTKIYRARRLLVERLGLLRIRAGSRLRGYHRHADRMSPEDYVVRVARGEIADPTLTFQLRRGFHVLAVVPNYLGNDPHSMGHAAVIEWINEQVATPEDRVHRDPRFQAESARSDC
jgi:ribosomal protein S18 acetylase RimI-like enzyme